jgi:hypothetical protein
MSGYRDELDSALRQLKVAREEAARLREELDATRRAGGSSLGVALAAWSNASPRARGGVLVAPLMLALLGLGLYVGAHRLAAPPVVVSEPLVPEARPTPICPPPRPCIERHRRDDDPPISAGVIDEGRWRGYRLVRPSRGSEDPRAQDGLLIVRSYPPRSCTVDGEAFRAPTTLNRRPGEYTVECEIAGGQPHRWRAVVVAGMLTELVATGLAPRAPAR